MKLNKNRIAALSMLISLFTGISSVHSTSKQTKTNEHNMALCDLLNNRNDDNYSHELFIAARQYLCSINEYLLINSIESSSLADKKKNLDKLRDLFNEPKKHILSNLEANKGFIRRKKEAATSLLTSLGAAVQKLALSIPKLALLSMVLRTSEELEIFEEKKYYQSLTSSSPWAEPMLVVIAALSHTIYATFKKGNGHKSELELELDLFISNLKKHKKLMERKEVENLEPKEEEAAEIQVSNAEEAADIKVEATDIKVNKDVEALVEVAENLEPKAAAEKTEKTMTIKVETVKNNEELEQADEQVNNLKQEESNAEEAAEEEETGINVKNDVEALEKEEGAAEAEKTMTTKVETVKNNEELEQADQADQADDEQANIPKEAAADMRVSNAEATEEEATDIKVNKDVEALVEVADEQVNNLKQEESNAEEATDMRVSNAEEAAEEEATGINVKNDVEALEVEVAEKLEPKAENTEKTMTTKVETVETVKNNEELEQADEQVNNLKPEETGINVKNDVEALEAADEQVNNPKQEEAEMQVSEATEATTGINCE